IPMAAAAGCGFQYQLIGQARKARWWVWSGVAVAAMWAVVGETTRVLANGVWRLHSIWFAEHGSLTWLVLLTTVINATPGFIALGRHVVKMKPGIERRQLGLVFAASLITYSGL